MHNIGFAWFTLFVRDTGFCFIVKVVVFFLFRQISETINVLFHEAILNTQERK